MKLSEQVIYQIYPKSFYDSNGDGVGDLRGVIEKIDYLKKLNIDMIWFNPFFVSPQNDNGYDIADYYHIDPMFGTMADFEELVAKLKANGIGVMLDMVLNHTSTEHEWFQKALAGDEKYQKFYYLRPPKADGSLPTIGNLNLVVRPGRRLVILVCTIYIYMIRLRPIWIGIIRPYDKRVPPLSTSGGKRACRVFVSMSSMLPVRLRNWWTHLRGSLARRCILTPPLFMII